MLNSFSSRVSQHTSCNGMQTSLQKFLHFLVRRCVNRYYVSILRTIVSSSPRLHTVHIRNFLPFLRMTFTLAVLFTTSFYRLSPRYFIFCLILYVQSDYSPISHFWNLCSFSAGRSTSIPHSISYTVTTLHT
jgi:hypothetical protein